ncbi:hypothetical protein FD754_022929, partial [Muntiacus muntjak]
NLSDQSWEPGSKLWVTSPGGPALKGRPPLPGCAGHSPRGLPHPRAQLQAHGLRSLLSAAPPQTLDVSLWRRGLSCSSTSTTRRQGSELVMRGAGGADGAGSQNDADLRCSRGSLEAAFPSKPLTEEPSVMEDVGQAEAHRKVFQRAAERARLPRRVEPVCSGLQAQILRCYRDHLQEVLLCADLVRAYQHCVGSAHKG